MRYSMIYRTLLILAVIIASMPLALAEGESISLGSYSVAPGSTVDVPITIGNANLVAGGVVKITYDSTIVNVASVSSGDFGVPVANTNIAGVVTLSAAGTTAIGTSSAVLGVIKFEGVSSGTSTLAFQAYPNSYLSLENGSLVEASLSDGAITVSGSAGIIGDINGDGTVNYVDLGMLGASYGLSHGDGGYNANADLNGDSTVNYMDLGMLGAHYGETV